MNITFHNIDIVITADDAKEAYAQLQQRLSGLEFTTNTYSVHIDGQPPSEEKDVGKLVK